MSNVLDLPGFAATPDSPLLPHRRLIWLSRGLSLLFTGLMGVSAFWVLAAFVVVLFFANHVLVGAEGATFTLPSVPPPVAGMVRFSTQSLLTRVMGLADIVIAMIPVLFICWHLRGLFQLYARGVVFARENAQRLKRVGFWLVAWPIAKFGANMLFQLAGGTDKAWAQLVFLYALVLGLIVLAIAQVMEFGHEIEREKDSFV